MKRLFLFIGVFILLTGCINFKEKEKIKNPFLDENFRKNYVESNNQLKEEWKEIILKGEIPVGMEKDQVEKLLGKPYQIYISDTGMIEIWFYEDWYVGFDKDGKVIKFKKYSP